MPRAFWNLLILLISIVVSFFIVEPLKAEIITSDNLINIKFIDGSDIFLSINSAGIMLVGVPAVAPLLSRLASWLRLR